MKKLFLLLALAITASAFASCGNENTEQSVTPPAESQESVEESKDYMENADKVISSLDYTNNGKMGDQDGPAFAVYSNKGFSGASVLLDIENMEINTRLSDGRTVNGYMFLGVDVYNGAYWANCVDVGLCWSGASGGWHIFYNMYEPLNEGTPTWYESGKKLPKNDIYLLSLNITEDNYAVLTVEAQNGRFKDEVKLEVKGAKANGSNTAMLFNVALDYPADTKLDQNGNKSEDWKEITLGNTDKGLYLKSLRAYELKLYKGEKSLPWVNENNSSLGIWPDKALNFDYAPTQVGVFDGTEYYINLDMNRKGE